MTLQERLEANFKKAMKEKNEFALSVLRMARAATKNKQIELRRELKDEDVTGVLRAMVKQYRDAYQDFKSAGREDLAERQQAEIEILESYLPPAMSETELETICRRVITEQNGTREKLGQLIGQVMKQAAGRADGNQVRQMLEKML